MTPSFNPTWTVHTHIIPAAHPRGYRRGVRDPETSRLKLHVKQYLPETSPSRGITVIVQHGSPPGDKKETFEPFLRDLLCQPNMPPIRSFWTWDSAISGDSFVLNRGEIGDEPHWFDPARDLVQLINHFQEEMRPPILAYCHSYGANAGVACAAWSPQIFQGMILCEPVFENGWHHMNDPARLRGELPRVVPGMLFMGAMAKRKTRWPTRKAAEEYFTKRKDFALWDRRVVDLFLKHDLQDLPDGSAQSKSPSIQSVQLAGHPVPPLEGLSLGDDYESRVQPESDYPPGFYNANGARAKQYLQSVNCPVLYQWATDSQFVSEEQYRNRIVGHTGTGVGGGGGEAKGQVTQEFIPGNHAGPLERPTDCAKSVAKWIREVFWPQWIGQERLRQQEPPIDPAIFPPALMKRVNKSMSEIMKSKSKL